MYQVTELEVQFGPLVLVLLRIAEVVAEIVVKTQLTKPAVRLVTSFHT